MITKKNQQSDTALKKTKKVEHINSIIPEKVNFPNIGVGASVGGLAAFEPIFSAMPNDKKMNMAFVTVPHLAPDYSSILTELLQRMTRMSAFEVEDGLMVKPNCVYVIPLKNMAFMNCSLQLLEPSTPRSQRFSIEFLFGSLAHDPHEWSICVIFSGTSNDGTLGLKYIKDEGDMAKVQSPVSCEFNGMVHSAINTRLVDHVLAPENVPAKLLDLAKYVFDRPRIPATNPYSQTDNILKKLFVMLRSQTGHGFLSINKVRFTVVSRGVWQYTKSRRLKAMSNICSRRQKKLIYCSTTC